MANEFPKYVFHEEFGEGETINGMQTLGEDGEVTSTDVMFEHGIVRDVPVEELMVLEGRGRPKGSKNKPKDGSAPKAAAPKRDDDDEEEEEEKDAYPTASHDGKHVMNALGGILDGEKPTGKVGGKTVTKAHAKKLLSHLHGLKPADRAHQAAQMHRGEHPMLKEDIEEIDEKKLTPKQKKLDKNHNDKLDAEDFKLLRKEEAEPKVSVYTEANRFRSVENAVREIMEKNVDLRKEAKENQFKKNNPDLYKK